MHIEEYPEIKKNGELITPKTTTVDIVKSFSEQMKKRGITNLCFFIDKEILKSKHKNQMVNADEMPSGYRQTDDFQHEDMLSLVMTYMEQNLSKSGKLAFISQIQNMVLSEIIESEDGYNDQTAF